MGNDYKDIEKILAQLAKENPEGMEESDRIDEAVFKRIEHNAFGNIHSAKRARKAPYVLRAVGAAFAIFAVFTLVLYFSDMPQTRATDNPEATSSEAITIMPSSVSMPKYIPERFVLDGIEFKQYQSWAAPIINYINPDDEKQYIMINVDDEQFDISKEYEKDISLYQKNGIDMIVKVYKSSPIIAEAIFTDEKGRIVQIVGTLSKQEILDIADGID